MPNGGMSSTLSIHSGFVAGEVGLIHSDMGGDPVHKTQPHVPSNEFTECAFELLRTVGTVGRQVGQVPAGPGCQLGAGHPRGPGRQMGAGHQIGQGARWEPSSWVVPIAWYRKVNPLYVVLSKSGPAKSDKFFKSRACKIVS